MVNRWNRIDRTISIPANTLHSLALWCTDVINSIDGVAQDATSVIINTRKKIFDLFSNDLNWKEKFLNAFIAPFVWIEWGLEFFVKPIFNLWANLLVKTPTNLVTNVRKSTLWSLISDKPVSDISFNSLKRKWNTYHIDTTKSTRSKDRILAKYRWKLTPAQKDAQREEKKRKLEERLAALGA